MTRSTSAPAQHIRALFLPGTRQAGKFSGPFEGETPDPSRRPDFLYEYGVRAILCDRNNAPLNPFANSSVLYAGLDPARAVRIVLFERRADVVICISENTAIFLLLLRRIFFFRPKVVLLEVSPRGWWIRDRILNFVVPRVDCIITLTTDSRNYVERTYRPKGPIHVVTSGVNEVFYVPRERTPEFDVLSLGEDGSRDFTTLLEAGRTMRCTLLVKTSQALSVPPEMKERVKILKNRISFAQLRELYAAARIVCIPLIPSDNAGGITTLLEAMAMGKPLVVSDHGTTRDHLTHGREGLIVPSRDPSAMRDALQKLLENPVFAADLGARARARVMREFAMPARAGKLAAVLRKVAGAPEWPVAGASVHER